MPRAWLRQSVRQNLSFEGAPQVAHGRTSFRLQLAVLWQTVHQERRVAASPSHAHGREEVRLSDVRKEVHAERSSDEARENAREPEEEKLRQQEGLEQGELGARNDGAQFVSRGATLHDDLIVFDFKSGRIVSEV